MTEELASADRFDYHILGRPNCFHTLPRRNLVLTFDPPLFFPLLCDVEFIRVTQMRADDVHLESSDKGPELLKVAHSTGTTTSGHQPHEPINVRPDVGKHM